MNETFKKIVNKWNSFFFADVHADTLAFARIVLFGFATYFFWNSARPDYPNNTFFDEWTPYFFYHLLDGPLSRDSVDFIFLGFRVFGILAVLGLFTRITVSLAAIFAIIRLSYFFNFSNEIYHHAHMISMALILVAFTPCGRAWSIDAVIDRFRKKQKSLIIENGFWFTQSLRLWIVLVYFTSGYQKCLYGNGLEWAWSPNLAIRILENPLMTSTSVWFLDQPFWLIRTFAMGALLIEVLAPLALLGQRWFLLFVPAWIGFHYGVKHVFGGHGRFLSQIVVILLCAVLLLYQRHQGNETKASKLCSR